MTKYGFVMDINNQILKIQNEEIRLCAPDWGDHKIQLVLSEDYKISPNSEVIVEPEIIEPWTLGVTLMKQTTEVLGVLIAKCHVKTNYIIVSVRIANPNNHKFILKRGVKIRACDPILKMTRIEKNAAQNNSQEVSKELVENLKISWAHLSKEHLCKATDFLRCPLMYFKRKITGPANVVPHRTSTDSSNSIH